MSLNVTSKIFATQCFFADHLKHKTVNKTTCRMSSANPHQLYKHIREPFNYYDNFLKFSGFAGLFDKVFMINFKFSSFENSTFFAGAM